MVKSDLGELASAPPHGPRIRSRRPSSRLRTSFTRLAIIARLLGPGFLSRRLGVAQLHTLSGDNSPSVALDIKSLEVDPPQSFCCRGSGEPMATCTPTYTSAATQECKPSMPSFEPRQFPPSSLEDVPLEYIIDQLRNLAPHYWNKPETADCTIVVPIPHAQGKPIHPTIAAQLPPQTHISVSSMYDPSGLGRRATQPALNFVPRISLKLHMDYLSAHSSYLRALFSGANPLDLVHTTCTSYNGPHSASRFNIPANRLPRLMPGSANHPVLLLPVPDPSSFHLLVHWMYFGRTNHIAQCLHDGVVHWEGLARNVEYLGLSGGIRAFLRRCYYGAERRRTAGAYDDDDSDTVCDDSDSEMDHDDYDSSTVSVTDDSDMDSDDDEKEPFRGRPRIRRPLSFQEPGVKQWYK
ncbi:hypothetical protein LshimejAT787_0203660 [Lyophyllum shimeji]|uniref:BTB domain-containing protein n=1 Tax=Lyophyllum shimeji TaxID=47721 RepID=A0A9P3PG19_LYOSH|nr:hypothetical protein LshimejAT787_0203660 [Lyophyllum shimeji]